MKKINNFNEYCYFKLAENIIYGEFDENLFKYILKNPNINLDILVKTLLNILKEKDDLKQLNRISKNNVYFFFYYLKENIELFSSQFVKDYHAVIEILNNVDNIENSKEYYMSQSLIRRLDFNSVEDLKEKVKKSLRMDLSILMTHTDYENSILKDEAVENHQFKSFLKYYSYNEIYLGSLNNLECEYKKIFSNHTFKTRTLKVLKNNKNIIRQLLENKYFIQDNQNLMEVIYGKTK